jgi:hypothetical protein
VTFVRALIVLVLAFVLAAFLPAPPADGTDGTVQTIWYVDQTDRDEWPVVLAARAWNANGEVQLVRTTSCADLSPCYVVHEQRLERGVAGLAYVSSIGGQVLLARAYDDEPWRMQREITCHELGHALGLRHYPRSCMSDYASGRYPVPTEADLERVRELW